MTLSFGYTYPGTKSFCTLICLTIRDFSWISSSNSKLCSSTSIFMSAIQLTVLAHQTQDGLPYQHLHIQISTADSILEPQDLKGLTLPEVQWQQGIVIEGKAPIWL
jgi:CRISPR-associated protein (Cas_csx3)